MPVIFSDLGVTIFFYTNSSAMTTDWAELEHSAVHQHYEIKHNYKSRTVIQVYNSDIFTLVIELVS